MPTSPGVYVEEIPSGVRTITGVSTSVAAFVDFFRRGPANEAVRVFNMGDFDREFGGLDSRSEGSYAIQQFFLNGGTEAWVLRVASGAAADVQIGAAIPASASALTFAARSGGAWGDNLRVRVDGNGAPGGFDLTVSEYETRDGRTAVARQEIFRGLSMDRAAANSAERTLNDSNTGSELARVTAISGSSAPLANGTLSGAHTADPNIPVASPQLSVTIGNQAKTASLNFQPPAPPGARSLRAVAPVLEAAIRTAAPAEPAFAGATVSVIGNRLRVLTGPGDPKSRVVFANSSSGDTTADALLLTGAATANSQEYVLGGGQVANTAQVGGTRGNDGALPTAADLIGNRAGKTGLFALEDVDLFNILCIPRTASRGPQGMTPNEAQAVLAVAEQYCEERRAFLLVDTPDGINEPREMEDWIAANSSLRHRNAALFYPRVRIPDPLDNFRLRPVGASGTMAGVFARTDATRGVWKAPAGTEAVLRNVPELDDVLTEGENGVLNQLGINCLRSFPVFGNICWGARTLEGSDRQASEWKYIPVRRLALFLEESLYRGLQWAVFEPNDEPLWAQIRLNVGAFMQNLFRQGAFQGQTPQQAYFVKCDNETTTQNDINLGIVNIVVGFAPLKPAEFVILKIQQIAGQIQT